VQPGAEGEGVAKMGAAQGGTPRSTGRSGGASPASALSLGSSFKSQLLSSGRRQDKSQLLSSSRRQDSADGQSSVFITAAAAEIEERGTEETVDGENVRNPGTPSRN
jgi:cyclophilin family peptidyl-prolyl cis-trans isomerase